MANPTMREVVLRARSLGVTTFETADIYGAGAVEECLGELLSADSSTLVVTKIGTDSSTQPPRKRFEVAWLEQRLAQSRRRLGPYLRCVALLHNPSFIRSEVVELMHREVERGEIQCWGVSAGSPEVAVEAVTAGAQVLEIPLNLLWTEEYAAVAALIQHSQVGLLARSVLAHGLLGRHFPTGHQFAASDHRSIRWSAEDLAVRLRQADHLHAHADVTSTTLRALALRYVLSSPGVSSVVLGPRNTLQLDQLVRDATPGGLEPEARRLLEELVNTAGMTWSG